MSLYLFQAPAKSWTPLHLTLGLTVDYEESDVQGSPELRERDGTEDATLSLMSLDALICVMSQWPVRFCPVVGVGIAHLETEQMNRSALVYPYGLNAVSGSPRIFRSLGLLAGGQILFYQPVWDNGESDRAWSASVGSVSLYIGVSY